MASLKEIKGRISSINSTRKITSAMKMVASAKLHRAQGAIANMLPYEEKLHAMLTAFLSDESAIQSPYMEERAVERVAVVTFSSNTSLCGAFNANLIRLTRHVLEEYLPLGVENVLVYPVGKKIADAMRKDKMNIQGDFTELAEKPNYQGAADLATNLMHLFLTKEIDEVVLVYHHMKTTSSLLLKRETYLPLSLPAVEEAQLPTDYLVEPSRDELIRVLLPKVLTLKIFTVLLDSNVSEHSARMMAMQIATDNADELIDELTILFNKSRQQAITNELLDIIGGTVR